MSDDDIDKHILKRLKMPRTLFNEVYEELSVEPEDMPVGVSEASSCTDAVVARHRPTHADLGTPPILEALPFPRPYPWRVAPTLRVEDIAFCKAAMPPDCQDYILLLKVEREEYNYKGHWLDVTFWKEDGGKPTQVFPARRGDTMGSLYIPCALAAQGDKTR